jgi:hypothetical protein
LALAGELIEVGLPGADGAEGDDLSAVRLSDRGDRDGVFVDSQADVKRASLGQG